MRSFLAALFGLTTTGRRTTAFTPRAEALGSRLAPSGWLWPNPAIPEPPPPPPGLPGAADSGFWAPGAEDPAVPAYDLGTEGDFTPDDPNFGMPDGTEGDFAPEPADDPNFGMPDGSGQDPDAGDW